MQGVAESDFPCTGTGDESVMYLILVKLLTLAIIFIQGQISSVITSVAIDRMILYS